MAALVGRDAALIGDRCCGDQGQPVPCPYSNSYSRECGRFRGATRWTRRRAGGLDHITRSVVGQTEAGPVRLCVVRYTGWMLCPLALGPWLCDVDARPAIMVASTHLPRFACYRSGVQRCISRQGEAPWRLVYQI